jgi:hypothetical protein
MTMTKAGNPVIDDKVQELLVAIDDKDIDKVRELVTHFSEEVLQDSEYAAWLCVPANITELHKRLRESLGVPQRAMQLRTRSPAIRRRAFLFCKAMLNGLNRVEVATDE